MRQRRRSEDAESIEGWGMVKSTMTGTSYQQAVFGRVYTLEVLSSCQLQHDKLPKR